LSCFYDYLLDFSKGLPIAFGTLDHFESTIIVKSESTNGNTKNKSR